MRCLLVADLHYALKQYDWVLEVAEDFELVVIAGDLLDTACLVDGRAQVIVVRKYLEQLSERTRLIVCSGNHDLDATDEAGEKTAKWVRELGNQGIATDGGSLFVGDALISVCPWWDGPRARDAIGEQLAADAEKRTGDWIWVYHAPPADSPVSWGGSRYFGDIELSEWIGEYKPDIVLCGHVHQSPFTPGGSWADRVGSAWVFNAGNQIGPAPTHIIIDLRQMMALWFSLIGNQFVKLDQGAQATPKPLVELPDWLRASGPALNRNPG